MIAAREKENYSYGQPQLIRPVITRNADEKSVRLYLMSLVVAAFLLGALFSYVNALMVNVGYRTETMRLEMRKLQAENQSLEAAIEKLGSLSRVEAVAVTQLGMVRPTLDNVMFVAIGGEKASNPSESEAGRASSAVAGPADLDAVPAALPAADDDTGILKAFLALVTR